VQVRAHACDAADHFNTILPFYLPPAISRSDSPRRSLTNTARY